MIRKNYESRIVKSTTHDTINLRPSYNNNNYNNRGKKNSYQNNKRRHYDDLDFLYANIILKIKRNGVILMNLEYTKYGDYYLPNIAMLEESEETKGTNIGKYANYKGL